VAAWRRREEPVLSMLEGLLDHLVFQFWYPALRVLQASLNVKSSGARAP
jgi:hypothetical protein